MDMLFTDVCVKEVVFCLADVCNVIFCPVFTTNTGGKCI
jgi:hypothetical protein